MIEKRPLLLTLAVLATTQVQAKDSESDMLPSLELLEYLAEFVEDRDGRLLGPMQEMDEAGFQEHDAHRVLNERRDR